MFDDHQQRTELQDIGEFGLIQKIKERVQIRNASTLTGIGDDAAVLEPGSKQILVSTDLLVEHIHFHLSYTPLKHLGYKAVVVNLSDIYAMNGTPTQITISLALSNRFSMEALDELYEGILLACERFSVDLVGGDTTSSAGGLMMSITAIGEVEKDKICYRSGAQEHDLICLSGDLGGAYVGLQILERERMAFKGNETIQPDLTGYAYVIERQLKPEPRKDVIERLGELGVIPTSMIDVSDGLSSDLLHICESSKVGCAVYAEKIPQDYETIKTAEELGIEPLVCALNGGEDYELLFTIKQSDYEAIKDEKRIQIIGHITDLNSGRNIVTKAGTQIALTAQGWNHFTTHQP
jgi:thiamine-monophosphate kinase